MKTVSDVFDYQRQYCAYYRVLEDDFAATERFLTVSSDNFNAYSSEFIKLLQANCSEVDVTLKFLCKLIDPSFNKVTFPEYRKCILKNNPNFTRATVGFVRVKTMMIAPWMGWGSLDEDKNGKSTELIWWKMYNKIKHDRTAICPETEVPYYKYANQGHVLYSLAALYSIVSYTLFLMCKSLSAEDANYFLNNWRDSSKLFNSFLVAGAK